MWDEINYPFPNLNCVAVEMWEWINDFVPHLAGHVITYLCWDWSHSKLVNVAQAVSVNKPQSNLPNNVVIKCDGISTYQFCINNFTHVCGRAVSWYMSHMTGSISFCLSRWLKLNTVIKTTNPNCKWSVSLRKCILKVHTCYSQIVKLTFSLWLCYYYHNNTKSTQRLRVGTGWILMGRIPSLLFSNHNMPASIYTP